MRVCIPIAVSVDAPVQSTYLAGDSGISIRCTLDVNVQINSLQLVWVSYEIVNITELASGSGDNDSLSMEQRITQSLDLKFDIVSVSDAGEYTCRANIEDSMGESILIISNLTLFVESKLFLILVLALKIIRKLNYTDVCTITTACDSSSATHCTCISLY